MLQRKTLNVAVSVALGATFAVSTGLQAHTAFWPHIVVSDQVDTIISVINTAPASALHYTIIYKNGTSNANPCYEYNVMLPTSKNDIQTIDLGAADAASSVLFEKGDGTGNVKWKGADYALGAIARDRLAGTPTPPIRALLLVDNQSDMGRASISGEATIMEYDVGAAWGYDVNDLVALANGGTAVDSDDYNNAASDSGFKTPFLPMTGGATTTVAFMVTPVLDGKNKSNMFDAYEGADGSYVATIGVRGYGTIGYPSSWRKGA